MTDETHLDGNTGIENINFHIINVQLTIIEEMLGSELYDKILTDYTDETLAGHYETIYNEYVKPVTKYAAIASYIKSPYKVGKAGVYKATGDDRELLTETEKEQFKEDYDILAQRFIDRFNKYISINKAEIPEYKTDQDEVEPSDNQTLTTDFRFL